MKNSEKFSDSDKEFYRIFSRIFQFYDCFTIERKYQLRRRNQTPNLHSSLSTPYLRHERVPAFPRDKSPSLPPFSGKAGGREWRAETGRRRWRRRGSDASINSYGGHDSTLTILRSGIPSNPVGWAHVYPV